MWHFTSRSGKWKPEFSHVLVFSVPQLPSSLFCSSTWEDGGVLCGLPYLGGWRSLLWTALPGLPCHLASRWFGPWEAQAEGGEGVGAILLPFLHCSSQRQWFCWVAPLSWFWPSLVSSYLIPLLPSAPRRQEMWRQEGKKGGNGFLQFLVHGCFTSPL